VDQENKLQPLGLAANRWQERLGLVQSVLTGLMKEVVVLDDGLLGSLPISRVGRCWISFSRTSSWGLD